MSAAPKKDSEFKKQVISLVSGGACGAATVAIGHPLDVRFGSPRQGPRPAPPNTTQH